MNKNNIIKNVKYNLVNSINPKYIEIIVTFTLNGESGRHFIFLDKENKLKDKDYLNLAKKKFNEDIANNKVTTIKGYKKFNHKKTSPLLVTFACIFGVVALSLAGLFTYQMLGGKFPSGPYTPAPSNECTLTLNLENCVVDGKSTYQKTYTKGATIDPVTVSPSDTDHMLKASSIVDSDYRRYWKNVGDGNFVFYELVMDKDYTIDIKAVNAYTLNISLFGCTINGSSEPYTMTYAEDDIISDVIVEPVDGAVLDEESVAPFYRDYWKKVEGTANYKLSGLVMTKNVSIFIRENKSRVLILNLTGCNVGGSHVYRMSYPINNPSDPVTVIPDEGHELTMNSVPSEYQSYWSPEAGDTGNYILNSMQMDDDILFDINANEVCTLTLNLDDCTVGGEASYTQTYKKGATIEDVKVKADDGYKLDATSIESGYEGYWKDNQDGTFNLSGLVMDVDHTIDIKAIYNQCTITLTPNNCQINGQSEEYKETYTKGETIDDIKVSPTTGYMLTEDSVPSEYQEYWNPEEGGTGDYILSGIEMNEDVTFEISAGKEINPDPDFKDVTITPSIVIPGEDYVGTITINDSEYVLPETISLSDETNEDIPCDYTLQLGRKSATLEIPGESISDKITVAGTPVAEIDMWYKRVYWWQFCSSDVANQRAISADIGQEVTAEVNGQEQTIVLIDVDKDKDPNLNTLHCTFEFKDPIKDINEVTGDFETYLFNWNIRDGELNSKNFDFVSNSTLNDKLRTNIGEIYQMLPHELTSVIKNVRKTAEISNDSGQTYVETGYNTQLFPLSYDEIYGEELTDRYEYYKETRFTPNGSWLRSPLTDTSEEYYDSMAWAAIGKTPLAELVDRSRNGVAPAFCI